MLKEVLSGEIASVYSVGADGSLSFSLKADRFSDHILCCGRAPSSFFESFCNGLVGIYVSVEGEFRVSDRGRIFAFEKIRPDAESEFFVRILKGIGPKKVRELAKKFKPSEIIHALENSPEKLLEVKGIGPAVLEKMQESWKESRGIRELFLFFSERGASREVSLSLVERVYRHFARKGLPAPLAAKEAERIISLLSENPYRLTGVPGVGFKTADRISLAMGVEREDPRRIAEGSVYVLSKAANEEGHTWLRTEDLCRRVISELFDSEGCGPQKVKESLKENPKVDFSEEKSSLLSLKEKEKAVFDFFKKAYSFPFEEGPAFPLSELEEVLSEFEERESLLLSSGQKRFLRKVFSFKRRAYALSGYAGTGKTTCLKAFLDICFRTRLFRPDEVVLCAFTGMAARRLSEVTGFERSKTIHSLLEYREGKFKKDSSCPLSERVIVLDEASMVNLNLFHSLVSALRPDSLFIIVGDPAQLPPIGPGNVFKDILNRRLIDSTELTEIQRQARNSSVVLIANHVRRGIYPSELLKRRWKDFEFIAVTERPKWKLDQKEAARARERENLVIRDLAIKKVQSLIKAGVSPSSIQVLSPMKKGPLGTHALNQKLQLVLNRNRKKLFSIRGLTIFEGDRVVNLENRDLLVFSQISQKTSAERVLNGQIGHVVGFDGKKVFVEIETVYGPRVAFFDVDDFGRKADLAYCLTVHKSQGSEYDYVILPLTVSHWYMLNSQWLYTALTRAKKKAVVIGHKRAFRRAAENTETRERQTWLSLKEESFGE